MLSSADAAGIAAAHNYPSPAQQGEVDNFVDILMAGFVTAGEDGGVGAKRKSVFETQASLARRRDMVAMRAM